MASMPCSTPFSWNHYHSTHVQPLQNEIVSSQSRPAYFFTPVYPQPRKVLVLTHSVSNKPGSTAFNLTFGPWAAAIHLIHCNCAAFVTQYGKLDPLVPIPAIELVTRKTPPSGLALNVGRAVRRRNCWALTFTAKQVSQSLVRVEFRSGILLNLVHPFNMLV